MSALQEQDHLDDFILNWLLEGDISIQYQVHRDLLGRIKPELQNRINNEGWGAKFMSFRNDEGHWGGGFYQPKWTSTHYSLLDIKNLGIPSNNDAIKETIELIIDEKKGPDGGVNPSRTIKYSDVCVNGMFLNYASYFKTPQDRLESIIDFLISVQMPDGGFNCRSNRGGAVHSSLHSTISVLEGFFEYSRAGYKYRIGEITRIEPEAREFILIHKLYRSDHTNEIIDKKMLMLSYPSRWRYDVLRALDYFKLAGIEYEDRMQDAIMVLIRKRRKDGKWPLQAKHPGKTHFDMEKTGKASRWNTLRALRVLKHLKFQYKTY
jgi:hypothetical protein